ncbi:MAG: hypothetical protein BRC40_14575 [Cyanobacteria bacterium QH_8_48_120]|nr:MAG: hypothetical protein BRC34_14280 [Cyanobacteria bacterium QH_1_48_107]PSO53560.1 MAG: hypothetical protein BRC35_15910 [Cyanobacteria bacterium QH_10_48_56]PSO57081.1 MAG: hypothetical protein BRC39_15940 [Cyanobacteria bacterium QH_7_48_89]PSO65421.1 MAG: hypothetical protein BRC38_08835 [Cyanobacteria bacterium QH_6_48_35]PSO69776.1 MAG: hypothetical protein BRC40_14575 [Cyanobacteria bacterium QH_8_48_120]PSO79520.1 MAG: hypothetical protein BRC45_15305 [Cyanobacteria bacterium QS_5
MRIVTLNNISEKLKGKFLQLFKGLLAGSVASSVVLQATVSLAEPAVERSQANTSSSPSPEQVRELQQQIESLQDILDLRQIYIGSPALSGGSPTAFGADFGIVFAGVGYQARTRFGDDDDAAIAAGFGLGNREEVALEVTVTSFSTFRSTFGDTGGISLKAHRTLPNDFAVAVGVENAILWGDNDSETSVYGVASKIFRLKESSREPFSRLSLSLGLGNGRFRSEDDIEDENGTINIFSNVSLRVSEPVSVFADWTGQDLNLGISILPFPNFPLVITPALQDVTGNAGDGTRLSLSVGTFYRF